MADVAITRRQILWLAILIEGGLGLVAALIGWLIGLPPWTQVELTLVDTAWGVLACLPMLVLFLVCLRWPVGPLRGLRQFVEEVIQPLFRVCTLGDLALICAAAGIGEEFLFRGLCQPYLQQYLPPWVALLLASGLFGLFHPISLTYIILATGFGIYLGGLLLLTDNLLGPIIAHGLYDFVALVYLVRRKPNLAKTGESL